MPGASDLTDVQLSAPPRIVAPHILICTECDLRPRSTFHASPALEAEDEPKTFQDATMLANRPMQANLCPEQQVLRKQTWQPLPNWLLLTTISSSSFYHAHDSRRWGLLPWPAPSDAILERQERENTKKFPSLLRIRHTGIDRKSGEMARNRRANEAGRTDSDASVVAKSERRRYGGSKGRSGRRLYSAINITATTRLLSSRTVSSSQVVLSCPLPHRR
jgi:hypothetical protein